MRWIKVLPVVLCCFLLSGCWDKVEIDRRLFVSTIAIDVGKDISKESELKDVAPDEPFGERQMEKIKVTFGYPDISTLGPNKGTTFEEKTLAIDAYSMQDAVSKSASKSSRSIHFGHLSLLALSSDILAYPETVKEIVDYLQRQPALNKVMQVIVVDGKAEDYLKYKPATEKNVESYIAGLTGNNGTNSSIIPVTLNEFLELLSENGNAILPRLSYDRDKKDIFVAGTSIIKNYELKGQMNPIETENIELLRGKLKSGKKTIFKDGHPIDFSIEGIKRKVSMKMSEGRIYFTIDLALEGELKEYYVGKEVFSKKILTEIESDFDKAIKQECEKVARMTQTEFSVDPIGLRDYVEKYHPQIWNSIAKNWEQSYKNATINVNVKTSIRRIGATR